MDHNTIAQLDGGARLYAIAQVIGDPDNSLEIKSGQLDLGDLEPFRRFILDNRAVWNVLRTLPVGAIQRATVVELRAAYTAIMSLCDGDKQWNGKRNAAIEGLTPDTAVQIICTLLCDEIGEFSVSDVSSQINTRPFSIIRCAIWNAAEQLACEFGLALSSSYNAAYLVDVRSIANRNQLFCAIPLIMISALTTPEQNLQYGLDLCATRNGYAAFNEMQEALSERFGLPPTEWVGASESIATELSGECNIWEKIGLLRRLVRRYRHSICDTDMSR